jgi:hypothetical protein
MTDKIRYLQLGKLKNLKTIKVWNIVILLYLHWKCFGFSIEKVNCGIFVTIGFLSVGFVNYKKWCKLYEERKING